MKKKIYIAGKVTGENQLDCAIKFAKAQNRLKVLGIDPINPLEVVGTWDIEWQPAMKKCIKAMMDADGVYLLPCTLVSKGATIEMNLANALGIPIFGHIELLKIQLEQWKNNSQPTP